jgi:hypothetical protein
MANSNFKQVVADYAQGAYATKGLTHDTVLVTKTATMENGSILKADGTEAAIADAAAATHIIDTSLIDVAAVGDVVAVSAVAKDAIVRKASLKFSDGAYTAEGLTALVAAGIKLV